MNARVLEIIKVFLYAIPFLGILAVGAFAIGSGLIDFGSDEKKASTETKTARVVANGDILIHDILYTSAKKSDGTYDFEPYFKYVKDRISSADLAIGDYEGTITDTYPLAGYPLFNAPKGIAQTLKNTGYDMVDLAHNHILDSGLQGAIDTVDTFRNIGIDTVGLHKEDRNKEGIVIKEVNGIKIATIAYTYGFNGLDSGLTPEQKEKHLSDLNQEKMKAEIERAEKEADVTIIMPQDGVEYALEPTQAQRDLYRKMVEWGADVVLGGHPHVIEPSETITKDGDKKFIIYSMGNFISNQRMDMMADLGEDKKKWPERGLLMDLTFEKTGDKTIVKTVQAHPTLVWATPKGVTGPEGYQYFDYRVMVLEDFIEGGKYRQELDAAMQAKVDTAYKETKELVNLQW